MSTTIEVLNVRRKVSVSARLSPGLYRELKALAAAEQATLTEVIEKALNDRTAACRKRRSGQFDDQTITKLNRQVQAMASGMQQLAAGMDRLQAQMKAQAEAPVRLPPVIAQMASGMKEQAKGYMDIVNAVNAFGPAIAAAMAKNNSNLVERLREWLRDELSKIFPFTKAKQEKR